jgi:myo-inositol-1(or 4)-monophosphatase
VTGAALERARAVAFEAARAAGEVLLAAFGRLSPDDVRYKGEKDLVTVVDERAQDAIVERLASEFPEHGIFAEEGTTERRDAEYRWVVDPLDGTTNFVHAYPMVSVSIALERAGAPLVGVVHAPVMGETFDAVVGGGARRNGEAIRVSRRERLIDALLGTGFACVRGGATRTNLPIVSAIAPRAQGVRRGGSAALDLAYVAMGRFDGFWELELSPWDTAAGVLLVREAGGRVTDFDDGPDFVARREIVATNGVLHPALLAAIREVPA